MIMTGKIEPHRIVELKAEDIFPFYHLDPFDFGCVREIGIKGHCKGSIERAGRHISTAPLFDQGIHNLESLVQEGKIAPRDFKVRFDGCEVVSPRRIVPPPHLAVFRYGVTHFYECKEDMNKSKEDVVKLMELGTEFHEDQGYFLARGMGAVVLPMTSDRKIVVGVRNSTEYDGEIHGPAGWLTFSQDVEKISPLNDAYRELGEELAVFASDVESMYLMGAVAYRKTLETDVIYFARLTQPSAYFESGAWKEAVDAKEHRELILLSTPDEIDQLVTSGKPPKDNRKFEVVDSTHYGLSVLRDCYQHI